VLRGAPVTLNMKPSDVRSTYLDHRAERRSDRTPGALDIDIYVSSDFGGRLHRTECRRHQKQVNYPS